MTKQILTQEYLKSILHYNPETGVLIWIVRRSGVYIGKVAGSISTVKTSGIKYICVEIDGKSYKAHRLAVLYMTGYFPPEQTDHEDGNGLNNKWDNLREVNQSKNQRNKRRLKNNKSGCTGVCFDKESNKWQAYIGIDQVKNKKLGRFVEIWDAICARKSAEFKYGYHVNHGRIEQVKG